MSIIKLNDSPVVLADTFQDALNTAIAMPSLEEALTYVCIWESERIVKQARFNFGSGSDGAGWDTCFGYIIQETMKAYMTNKSLVMISINADL